MHLYTLAQGLKPNEKQSIRVGVFFFFFIYNSVVPGSCVLPILHLYFIFQVFKIIHYTLSKYYSQHSQALPTLHWSLKPLHLVSLPCLSSERISLLSTTVFVSLPHLSRPPFLQFLLHQSLCLCPGLLWKNAQIFLGKSTLSDKV